MAELFEKLSKLKPVELAAHSEEAMNWFRETIRYMPRSRNAIYREGSRVSSIVEGNMYMMFYDAKTKEKLSYYDMFPLVIPFDILKDGFLGINLHYIAPRYRVMLLDELYKHENNTKEGVLLTYKLLQKVTKLKYAKPCLKRYLTSHIVKVPVEIEKDFWDLAAMIPSGKFATGSISKRINTNTVYAESRKQF